MKELVSIIIPTYRRTELLQNAIQSCIDQTYTNIEILIIDDNVSSSYNLQVKNIIDDFNDSRIKLFVNAKNLHGGGSRNVGIVNSKGKYIAFLDDDDVFLNNKIDKQLSFMVSRNSLCSYTKIENDKHRKIDYREGDLTLNLLKMETFLYTPTLMFRNDVLLKLKGFDTKLKRHQDFDLMLRFFEIYKIDFLDLALSIQGPNDGGNTLYGKRLHEMKSYFLDKFKPIIEKYSKREKRSIYGIHYSRIVFDNLKNREFRYALLYLGKSLKNSPYYFFKYFYKRILLTIHAKFL